MHIRERRTGSNRRSLALLVLMLSGCDAPTAELTTAERMQQIVLQDRFTAGRLTALGRWRSCAGDASSATALSQGCGEPLRPGTRLWKQIQSVEREALPGPGATSTHLRARGIVDLRWSGADSVSLNRAIDFLERAHRAAPDDAAILNDLAVGYMEMAERVPPLTPLLRALDAEERALARNPVLLPALFNRAVILDRLYLQRSADLAWQRYLALEHDAGWRLEAESRSRRVPAVTDIGTWNRWLTSPPEHSAARAAIAAGVRTSPQAAREFAFKLLGAWGTAVVVGDSLRAARLLETAGEIGHEASTAGLDRSITLAMRAIRSAAADRRQLRTAAWGHAYLARGMGLYATAAYGDAAKVLGTAERSLRSVGSPAARWAAYYRAGAQVQFGAFDRADVGLQEVRERVTEAEPALRGKATAGLGVSQLRRGHYETATLLYRTAAPFLAQAHEPEGEGSISYFLAESLSLEGRQSAARAEAYRGLRTLAPFRRSNFLNNHLGVVAAFAHADGLDHAALAVMEEGLALARSVGGAEAVAWALRTHAQGLMVLGRATEARTELQAALALTERMKPGHGRDRVRADVSMVLGQLLLKEDPHAAFQLLARTAETYRAIRLSALLPAAQYDAARAAGEVGDTRSARRYLGDAVTELERQHTSFQSAELRASFSETVEKVFDAAIVAELSAGRPASAFTLLERARLAAWPPGERRETLLGRGATGEDITKLYPRLPKGMLLVDYALLRDEVLIWTATRRGWRQFTVRVPRDTVAALAERYVREVGRGAATADARRRLYDLLIRPIQGEMTGVRQLTVVPDRELSGVPFAGLRDRESGRFLVEDYQLRTVPNVAYFFAAREHRPTRRSGSSALVIGSPAFDPVAHRTLRPLPGAIREARKVASFYSGARLLTGTSARRDEVLRRISGASLIHFAGHAIANAEQPELSYLVLAPEGEKDDGMLRAWEIGRLRLSSVEVVVLSACSTLNPRASRAGPTVGLAYSFLRAGAPATVSTLWDVGDDAAEELIVDFHRRYAAGASPAEALRLAQVAALHSPRGEMRVPGAWAGFIYTGP